MVKQANPINQLYSEAPIKALIEAIRNLHGCKATWVESVPVKETFQGEIFWEGEVQVRG